MKEIICIVCPKGCLLTVEDGKNYKVSGNLCLRGEEYGREELHNPVRMVTSTVRLAGAIHPRCPVKTTNPIPKSLIFDAMRLLDDVELSAPVEEGTVVVRDICGTGVDFVTTRAFDKVEKVS